MKNRDKGKHIQEIVQQQCITEADSDKKIPTLLVSEIHMFTLGLFYHSNDYEHTEKSMSMDICSQRKG